MYILTRCTVGMLLAILALVGLGSASLRPSLAAEPQAAKKFVYSQAVGTLKPMTCDLRQVHV